MNGDEKGGGGTLRMMTAADLPAVLELEHALFGDDAWSRRMLEGELAEQPRSRYYLVADVLTRKAVDADRWGQGIGSALLEALLTEAARRSAAEVFLEVRTDNTRAQRLYRRYGFTQIGIRKGYYQPSGADALVMRRDLGGGA
jgi:ribosomal-protein-alanine N-acetyltransferase